MDLGYMYSLLHLGYDLPNERKMKSEKKINNIEIGWSLGASIQMVF
jgi:guanosine-diphosphatase